MVFTRFKEGYFWKKIGSQKWPKIAKKACPPTQTKSQKSPEGRGSRMDPGPAT